MHDHSFVPNTLLSNLVAGARHPRHVVTTAALGLLLTACGGGTTTTDGGDTEGLVAVPGYVVDCTPEIADDPLMCMAKVDWNCPQRDFYVRESYCARLTEGPGTPSEYKGVPKLTVYDPDGPDGPLAPISDLDCADTPDDMLSTWDGGFGCDDCRVCDMQIVGNIAKSKIQDYGWDEIPFCPETQADNAAGELCGGDEPTPTTGDEEDPNTGGSGLWKCMGSWTIMGTMIETDLPQSKIDVYMSPPNIPKCVNATDEADARGNCFDVCDFIDGSYEKEAANSDSKNWVPFHCADLNEYTPLETFNPFECEGGGPMNPPPTPFMATGRLVMGDLTATTDQLSGSLDFTIGTCNQSGTCTVTLGALNAGPRTTQGQIASSSGKATSFAVADLSVALLQPALGELDPRTGAVKFSGEGLFASVSTGVATLDDAPISDGLHEATFVVKDAQGRWDGRHLTLDLDWSVGGAALTLRIIAD